MTCHVDLRFIHQVFVGSVVMKTNAVRQRHEPQVKHGHVTISRHFRSNGRHVHDIDVSLRVHSLHVQGVIGRKDVWIMFYYSLHRFPYVFVDRHTGMLQKCIELHFIERTCSPVISVAGTKTPPNR